MQKVLESTKKLRATIDLLTVKKQKPHIVPKNYH